MRWHELGTKKRWENEKWTPARFAREVLWFGGVAFLIFFGPGLVEDAAFRLWGVPVEAQLLEHQRDSGGSRGRTRFFLTVQFPDGSAEPRICRGVQVSEYVWNWTQSDRKVTVSYIRWLPGWVAYGRPTDGVNWATTGWFAVCLAALIGMIRMKWASRVDGAGVEPAT